MRYSSREFVIAGLPIRVFGLDELSPSSASRPIAVEFILHGRMSKSEKVVPLVEATLRKAHEARESAARDLIVVTFDQRNHGGRTVDKKANLAWEQGKVDGFNERHAIDMYATQTGTASDVSFLISFLRSYLFPTDERTVDLWICAGVSLGGHATWIALKNDPRITIGVPLIGCPDYLTLISHRASKHSLPLTGPYFPSSLRSLVASQDPASAQYTSSDGALNPFLGKRIAVLSGADDALVPWSSNEQFVGALEVGPKGVKEVKVFEGVGHATPPVMLEAAADFVVRQAVLAQQRSAL